MLMCCKGSSLIEVLVSLFLLSIMVGTCSHLYFVALREAKSDYYFNVAMQQIKNILEYLSISQTIDVARASLRWNQQNQIVLPSGHGRVRGRYPHFIVSIGWGNRQSEDCLVNRIGPSGCLSLTS